jgi:polysaccharide export outer membrane protein
VTSKSARYAAVVLAALFLAPPACKESRPPATSPDASHAEASQPAGTPPEFVAVPPSELPTEKPVEVSPPTAPSSEAQRPPYVVAVEDVLEISVYGDPELTRLIPVRPDGKISYTFIGDVDAAGRPIDAIRTELKQRLSSYLRSPEVTVIAKEFGRQKVYVGGEVKAPGVFFLTSHENTLADVFFKAGLVTEKADISKAVLVRRGHIVDVDFARMIKGDISLNVPLESGDLVYVPESSERYVYALGEVKSQGAIETTVPVSVLNVLARSGGVNPGAAKSKEIAILRGGLKDPKVAVVNFKRLLEGDLSQNVMVKPGDIVYVPTTGLGKYNQFLEQILRTLTFLFQGRVVQQSLQ